MLMEMQLDHYIKRTMVNMCQDANVSDIGTISL